MVSYSFSNLHIYLVFQEANGLFDFLVTILEVLPLWRSVEEPLSSKFEVYHQVAKKICNRCKLVTVYPVERSYGLIVVASSLREIKASQLLFYFIILSVLFFLKMMLEMFFFGFYDTVCIQGFRIWEHP